MKKRLMVPAVAAAIVGLMAAFATTAQAHPTYPQLCTGCHPATTAITVTLTQTANNGMNATYNISVSNPYGSPGWAVFNGGTRLAGASGGSGSFVVADGGTYTVYGAGAGSSMGSRAVTIQPVAPTPPPTPTPTGTPNPTSTPVPTPDPTPVPPVATDPGPVAPAMYTVRLHLATHGHLFRWHRAVLISKTTGGKWYAKVDRRGNVTFTDVVAGTYRLHDATRRGHFGDRTIAVPLVAKVAAHKPVDD